MRPVTFAEQSVVFGEGQEQYLPLPAHLELSTECRVTTCWELSDEDIAELTRTRKLWLQQLTFGRSLQPQLPSAVKPEMSA